MVLHALIITNTSSSIQFSRIFQPRGLGPNAADSDKIAATASLFGVLMGYTAQISPTPARTEDASPMRRVEGVEHDLHFFRAPTGTLFVLVSSSGHDVPQALFDKLYLAFAELISRHPTYKVGELLSAKKHADFAHAVDEIIRRAP